MFIFNHLLDFFNKVLRLLCEIATSIYQSPTRKQTDNLSSPLDANLDIPFGELVVASFCFCFLQGYKEQETRVCVILKNVTHHSSTTKNKTFCNFVRSKENKTKMD